MQRLFSTFANGWPGVGLLIQRVVAATIAVHCACLALGGPPNFASTFPQIVAICAGILLLLGLWTPIVGALIAVVEIWVATIPGNDPWMPIALATFGGTAAMIGPGAWSIDARLFGRKHIETRDKNTSRR